MERITLSLDKRTVVISAIVIAILAYQAFAYMTTLGGSSTAYDFQRSSPEAQAAFLEAMCKNGACLTYADWKCGFTNGDDYKVRECFTDLTKVVKPWTNLDLIRKHCGQKYMQFEGNLRTDETQCARENGKWGKPFPLERLE